MTAPWAGAALLGAEAPVLVLAPHADDESLGCGLLLAHRWRRGLPTHVACLTDGAASHPASRDWPGVRLAALRRAELDDAVCRLGGTPARDVTWLGYPDAALHRLHGPGDDLVRRLAVLADGLGAGTIVAASPNDPHCDHEAGGRAALRLRAIRPRLRLCFYPIWSRWRDHGADPGREGDAPVAIDLPEHRATKRRAIAAHRSQRGLVVADDPNGFRMPDGFAAFFAARPEHYFPVGP